MTKYILSRRAILIAGAAISVGSPLKAAAKGAAPTIHVMKDPNCGCS